MLLEALDDPRSDDPEQRQQAQHRRAPAHLPPDRFGEVVVVADLGTVAGHTGHLLEVLLRLLLDDVDGVVVGDDADQPPAEVDHRQRDQVVVADDARGLFLVGVREHRHQVGLHDLADRRVLVGEDQIAQRHEADQLAGPVEHVAVVDGLLARRLPPQLGDRRPRRQQRIQHRIVGRQERADLFGPERVAAQQILAGRVRQQRDQLVAHPRLQPFEEGGAVVAQHRAEQPRGAGPASPLHEGLLDVRIQVPEHVALDVGGEQAEGLGDLLRLQRPEDVGGVGRVHLLQDRDEVGFVAVVQQFADFGDQQVDAHGPVGVPRKARWDGAQGAAGAG